MKKFVFFVLVSLLIPQGALAVSIDGKKNESVKISRAERRMAQTITAERLKNYLSYIASDDMAGRNTPSKELDMTAQYLALHLKLWGFKPAGDNGTFFQKMFVKRERTLNTSLDINGKSFKYGDDYVKLSGDMISKTPYVFAGDGWMVKSKGIDAFSGIDVKNKLVVLYSEKPSRGISPPRPDGVTDEDVAGEKGVDWADPATYAKKMGAKGIIVIMSPAIEGRWANIKRFFTRGGASIEGLGNDGGDSGPGLPTLLVSSKVASAMFEGSSGDYKSGKSFDPEKSAAFSIDKQVDRVPTYNVVALWEGSDPVLKDEMVAVGAHYDHVGTNQNAPGDDKIWNGADDDGSGTVGVLAIAEALKDAPERPRRSVLLVWHAGEEKGLWGSAYFNKYPTVDINKVVAQLNIDMIGRSKKKGDTNPKNKDLSGPNEVYVIGSEMMSSTLGAVTKETNTGYAGLKYNYKYDDPKDTNRFFFRSDHFNYAVNGIPVVFWFTGVHEDYHQPGDEVHKIDFNKMEKIVRTIFLTTWELTALDERPAVDKELPPELKRRN
ncbi:MAG: M20/M25/M40 family metallo-hydrolase [Pyrinomonadaceae bacterium]|nr:M20/M25/M40 family metallo-hydrolase [Pyrinomonadaceae bacterium]